MTWTTTTIRDAWIHTQKGGVRLSCVVSGRLHANRDSVVLKDTNGDTWTIPIASAGKDDLPDTFVEAMAKLGIIEEEQS